MTVDSRKTVALMAYETQKCCISRISVSREIKRGGGGGMKWAGHVARVNENCMRDFGGEA
jgi:hypothetical protein